MRSDHEVLGVGVDPKLTTRQEALYLCPASTLTGTLTLTTSRSGGGVSRILVTSGPVPSVSMSSALLLFSLPCS